MFLNNLLFTTETFKEALCREKHDAQYSNTEDENEVIEMNNYRRRHPVLSQNNNEVNETSDSEQEKRITKVNIKNTINYTRKFVPKDPLDLNHLIQPKNGKYKCLPLFSNTITKLFIYSYVKLMHSKLYL